MSEFQLILWMQISFKLEKQHTDREQLDINHFQMSKAAEKKQPQVLLTLFAHLNTWLADRSCRSWISSMCHICSRAPPQITVLLQSDALTELSMFRLLNLTRCSNKSSPATPAENYTKPPADGALLSTWGRGRLNSLQTFTYLPLLSFHPPHPQGEGGSRLGGGSTWVQPPPGLETEVPEAERPQVDEVECFLNWGSFSSSLIPLSLSW